MFETKSEIAVFGGKLLKLSHKAASTKCDMAVSLFLPPKEKVPVVIYLAGLTCTPDNGAEKGFFNAWAAEKGIAVLYPDTSPRGLGIQGEDDSWDFGTGAGFYLDATKEPYRDGYKMETYITKELPEAIFEQFKELDSSKVSIMGHSMGGHGALTLYLRHPELYKSVSAFAPICNPINCPWGQKAFSGYFSDEASWKEHDATELVKNFGKLETLIDVGTADQFYKQGQLLPEKLASAGGVQVRYHEGYDHSYYFISTFAKDHIEYHAKHLL